MANTEAAGNTPGGEADEKTGATIWRTRDRLERDFELTETRWAHIMEKHESEMAGREADVRAAVERLDQVTTDNSDPRRECFYRNQGPGQPMLKVVVGYEPAPPPGNWAGKVITAYPTSRVPMNEVSL